MPDWHSFHSRLTQQAGKRCQRLAPQRIEAGEGSAQARRKVTVNRLCIIWGAAAFGELARHLHFGERTGQGRLRQFFRLHMSALAACLSGQRERDARPHREREGNADQRPFFFIKMRKLLEHRSRCRYILSAPGAKHGAASLPV